MTANNPLFMRWYLTGQNGAIRLSNFVNLRESYPTHPAEAASTCDALCAANSKLVALHRIESIHFALFLFTDFNQKYTSAYQCFVWVHLGCWQSSVASLSMKCLGHERCEVCLGSWQSSDASLSMKCLGRDRCEAYLGSWKSSDASCSMKCLGHDRCEMHLGLHLPWVVFSCFVSLQESYPTHSTVAASTCDALFAENSNLVALCRIESIRFALFQFTDFNQKYTSAFHCIVWAGGQIRASVVFYWSSPLIKCHWISREL